MDTIYQQYLRSTHWKFLRQMALQRDEHRCQTCGTTERLEVHHKVYRRQLEAALLSDLTTLCHMCHAKLHGCLPRKRFDREFNRLEVGTRFARIPLEDELVELALLIQSDEDRHNFHFLIKMAEIAAWPEAIYDQYLRSPAKRNRLWHETKARALELEQKALYTEGHVKPVSDQQYFAKAKP